MVENLCSIRGTGLNLFSSPLSVPARVEYRMDVYCKSLSSSSLHADTVIGGTATLSIPCTL
jgi:hypothetical protein